MLSGVYDIYQVYIFGIVFDAFTRLSSFSSIFPLPLEL